MDTDEAHKSATVAIPETSVPPTSWIVTKPERKETFTKHQKNRNMIEIKKEIDRITGKAQNHIGHIVRLNELILFSTDTGDAWILDTDDNFAICLVKSGVKQKYKLIDTPGQFGFDWDYGYQIDGDQFTVINKMGGIRTIIGYPLTEIERIIKKTQ